MPPHDCSTTMKARGCGHASAIPPGFDPLRPSTWPPGVQALPVGFVPTDPSTWPDAVTSIPPGFDPSRPDTWPDGLSTFPPEIGPLTPGGQLPTLVTPYPTSTYPPLECGCEMAYNSFCLADEDRIAPYLTSMPACASCSAYPTPESCYVNKFAPGDPNRYWASAASCIQRCFPQGVPLTCRYLTASRYPAIAALYTTVRPCHKWFGTAPGTDGMIQMCVEHGGVCQKQPNPVACNPPPTPPPPSPPPPMPPHDCSTSMEGTVFLGKPEWPNGDPPRPPRPATLAAPTFAADIHLHLRRHVCDDQGVARGDGGHDARRM